MNPSQYSANKINYAFMPPEFSYSEASYFNMRIGLMDNFEPFLINQNNAILRKLLDWTRHIDTAFIVFHAFTSKDILIITILPVYRLFAPW